MSLPLQLSMVLAQIDFTLPGEQVEAPRPATATDPKYFEILERNTHIIYPVLGILVLVLIAAGILQAWRTQDLDGLQKAELKRDILQELRKQLAGVSAETLARKLGMEPLKLVRLLEEMQNEGILLSHTNTERLTVWRLKGVGTGPAARRAIR